MSSERKDDKEVKIETKTESKQFESKAWKQVMNNGNFDPDINNELLAKKIVYSNKANPELKLILTRLSINGNTIIKIEPRAEREAFCKETKESLGQYSSTSGDSTEIMVSYDKRESFMAKLELEQCKAILDLDKEVIHEISKNLSQPSFYQKFIKNKEDAKKDMTNPGQREKILDKVLKTFGVNTFEGARNEVASFLQQVKKDLGLSNEDLGIKPEQLQSKPKYIRR